MKSQHDLVRGHLRKAESDLANADLCIKYDKALDTACFHAQQAAERALKAFLQDNGIMPPKIHNLMQLVNLAKNLQPDFAGLFDDAAMLTPFAVAMRYDQDFWPTAADALAARNAAVRIKQFCESKIKKS